MNHRVDVFCHILPKKFDAARWPYADKSQFFEHSPAHIRFVKGDKTPLANYQVLTDLDARFKMMEQFENYRQVLCVATPSPEVISPEDSVELSRNLNDEVAEIVAKHPKQFVGAMATLPLNHPDAACREMERCSKDLKMLGVQLFSNVLGKPLDLPEFRPIFKMLSDTKIPILLHPARSRKHPDYTTETDSKYVIWQIFGWPYESTAAMARLVFSGIMEEFPNLKIIVHHTAAMVPFFAGRLEAMIGMFEPLITEERGFELKRPMMEYFRAFYGDTSTFSKAAIECAVDFFGAEHLLFGTDAPFDAEGGAYSIRESTRAVEEARLTPEDRAKIYYKNFETIFGVSATG